MSNYCESSVLCPDSSGWHRVFFSQFGPEDGPVVMCVHYLTGSGRYFDWLAPALAARGFRVIAPDMPGRGRSDFLKNPADYNGKQYLSDIAAVLACSGVTQPASVNWIGASMGGLIGIAAAAMENSPVKRLVLVDVGPAVEAKALQQISMYLTPVPVFDNFAAFETNVRQSRAVSWGPVPDSYWPAFAYANARPLPNGKITYAYDPAIAKNFDEAAALGVDMWPLWDSLSCPRLIIRGQNSPLLTAETAARMAQAPKTELETVKNAGHVPSLAVPAQIERIADWLEF